MAPPEIRQPRRVLRYRNLLVQQAVRLKNRIGGVLMECGEEYVKSRLHGKAYFYKLLDGLQHTPESAIELLAISRGMLETFQDLERRLLRGLEVAEAERFGSVRCAVSYRGLCAAQRESAGNQQRGPLSKQRNKHLQRVLIEAAKLAPRFNPELREVHERELLRGSRNRATLAVARKLVA